MRQTLLGYPVIAVEHCLAPGDIGDIVLADPILYRSPQVPKLCGVKLILGDDHGDADCTFICALPPKHTGRHSVIGTSSNGANWHMEWTKRPRKKPTP